MAENTETKEVWCNLCGVPLKTDEELGYRDEDYAGEDFSLCDNCVDVIIMAFK